MRLKYVGTVLAIAIFVLSLLSGCGAKDPLAGTEWVLVDLGDRLPQEGTSVTLAFKDGQAYGSAGCNSYGGEYTLKGDEISFGAMASTLMACSDQGVMEQETLYLQRLAQASTYSLENGMLVLYLSDGSLMSFSQ